MRIKTAWGLSLVELMIGLLVGSIVVSGAIKIFSNSVHGSYENTQIATLHQDLRSMLDLMLHELRRAGFATSNPDSDANGIPDDTLKNNLFSEIQIEPESSCIVYLYNKNANAPPVENNERFGFKLVTDNSFRPPKKVLKVRRSAPALACNSGTWENLTAPDVEITELKFTLHETPLNISKAINSPSEPIVKSCLTGDKCLYIRSIDITLTGRLTNMPNSELTLNGSVKIRNDRYLVSAP